MTKKRRIPKPSFEAKVALAAVRRYRTISEIANQYGVHSSQVRSRGYILLGNLEAVFASDHSALDAEAEKKIKGLHAKIDELTVQPIL